MSTHTLLIRLAGPLQSWGTISRFAARRDTHSRPTKSAVIGMCAAALGLERTADLSRLASLRYGVRADHPGTPTRDFHLVGAGRFPVRPRDIVTDHRRAAALAVSMADAEGDVFGRHELDGWYGAPKYVGTDPDSGALVSRQLVRNGLVTERWYLADAAFVAALEHTDAGFLRTVATALEHPARLLWLGRKACPPSGTLAGPLQQGTIQDVFSTTALLQADGPAPSPRPWAWIQADPATSGASPVQDQPVTFDANGPVHATRWEIRTRIVIAADTTEWEGVIR
ncbi:type I-E CRISPR-associated protein Cas5/CasD [Streptomyces acidiscabies]|uniref:CRISPR-associated protein Cas5 n=1 Tax=Streptomyces acidiscabies TaxID=42234 RepID=A0A0L0KGM2_9ACTN|nr:type I-E CRISPR-associated protein Cas5/CasD [Streptomyces acidiscabies]KND37023.1 CRISPR-associated protein Cas5 [Streptomyces acidiscabies]